MRTAEETSGSAATAVTGGLLITGAQAGERTTVEALRLEDGLPVWWYDSRLSLSDLACCAGVVVVSGIGRPRPGALGPAAVVGLRAADGARLWHVGSDQLRRQLGLRRVTWGLQALWRTSSPTQAWQAMRSLALAGFTYLAVADEVALVCKEQVIFALSLRSGALRWSKPTLSNLSRPLIAAHGNRVYLQGDASALEAVDAQTGSKRWSSAGRYHVECFADQLAESETRVYLSLTHGRPRAIIALRLADGQREQALALEDGEAPAKVTADGVAYLVRGAHLRAVRVADGAELWRSASLRGVPDAERATVAPAVRVATGEQTVFYSHVVVTPPVHYVVVGALDASSGTNLWDWRGSERPLPVTGAPSLQAAQGKVYVITAAGIFALNGADGQLVWHAPGDATISRTVLSTDGFTSR